MALDFAKLARRLRKAREKKRQEKEEELQRQFPEKIEVEGTGTVPAQQQEQEEEEEKDEEAELVEGDEERISLRPSFSEDEATSWMEESEEEEDLEEDQAEDVSMQYPLIPSAPSQDERVFAWVDIQYHSNEDELIYRLHEPDLTQRMEEVLDEVENQLKEQIDVDFGQLKQEEAKNYMEDHVQDILESHSFGLSEDEKEVIQYYAYRNFVGLGKVEALMRDSQIEDISCDGVGIPIYVYHRNPKIGSVKTNVIFDDDEQLDAFVRKLAQRCGRSISMAEPLLDGSLPDGSRVQATLGTDIARKGTNFTIRRFTEEPLTPVHLMDYGTLDSQMLAYLWMAVEHGKSILIAGATAAGKTTLLNSISLFIRPELKIVSIEDTPELRLPHPNWVPETAREGFGFGEDQTGSVSLDDLLKESLRQRPDYIIVGEVRGEEAYILFQQIATGHPGMSTLHASSMEKVMDRLTTKPIDLPPSLIENLDIIVFAKRARRQGSYVRRADSIYEFEGYNKEKNEPMVNQLFKWDASSDDFDNPSDSSILAEIAEEQGIDIREVQEEMTRRKQILEWMHEQDITHYKDVGRIIQTYYHYPNQIMDRVEAEY
ncbi:MAG: type II/IV secretion system ATPase subunit [Candidatus Nanohaloarchaea archaeon]|nr:type II/IV secretion system ATPase subunit [Candidatus Nanohaloarchaea archaeon]